MIKKFNVSKPQTYLKDGVEKTYWSTIGVYTEFEKQDGSVSRIVEIPAIGLKASVFLQEPRETAPQRPQPHPVATRPALTPKENLDVEYPEETINPDDIPF